MAEDIADVVLRTIEEQSLEDSKLFTENLKTDNIKLEKVSDEKIRYIDKDGNPIETSDGSNEKIKEAMSNDLKSDPETLKKIQDKLDVTTDQLKDSKEKLADTKEKIDDKLSKMSTKEKIDFVKYVGGKIGTFLIYVGIGIFTVEVLEAISKQKSGCFVIDTSVNPSVKSKIFGYIPSYGKQSGEEIGKSLCVCGVEVKNPNKPTINIDNMNYTSLNENYIPNNLIVNQKCSSFKNCSQTKCALSNPGISSCGLCLPTDKTSIYDLNYKRYTISDVIAGFLSDAGYVIDAAGNIVKGGASIIDSLVKWLEKYWYVPLIVIFVIVFLILGYFIYDLAKASRSVV